MTDSSDPLQGGRARWDRPVPVIGDQTSATERAARPDAWAYPAWVTDQLYELIGARRDIRRYRPDDIDEPTLLRILRAAHAAPSVGHSQPWRFVIVSEPATRDKAALMADRARLAQAAQLEPEAARHLLDLQLEGIREAPLGIVVCCDRRVPSAGVLGRATFPDTDLWSCACAIENLWLAARAEGLGVGWVTLFEPAELADLVGLPDGVVPLGWLCIGWPDERPPTPGLERAGWSERLPLEQVVVTERWPVEAGLAVSPPKSKLRAPDPRRVVAARDDADELLTPPGSLGTLDRAVDRLVALGHRDLSTGVMVLAGGRHPVASLGVSAFDATVTEEVLAATRSGESIGAVAAAAAGLRVVVVDAGSSSGNIRDEPAMTPERVCALVEQGRSVGREAASAKLVALGEVGIGNTTVAAALATILLGVPTDQSVGLGAGADAEMLKTKRAVVAAAAARCNSHPRALAEDPFHALACAGGPEFALLTGVVLGAGAAGAAVVLDGLATSLAAIIAVAAEPAVAAHLIAGQRSREAAHPAVLRSLGLEPLLDLRIRAGEGVGASLAAGMLINGLRIRRETARTESRRPQPADRDASGPHAGGF